MRGARLLRPGFGYGPSFPCALTTGPRVPASSLYPISPGTAYTAAGVVSAGGAAQAANTGWSVSTAGAWSVSSNAVICGLSATGISVPGTSYASPVGPVLVTDCSVVTPSGIGGATYGIQARHTTGLTVQYCKISGGDSAANRVQYAFDDIYGDSVNLLVQYCDISWCRVLANIYTGTIQGCYGHDWGYQGGDHTDGVYANGTYTGLYSGNVNSYGSLQVLGNTLLMQITETCPMFCGGTLPGGHRNTTISGNLLAGGSYAMYLVATNGNGLRTDTGLGGCGVTSVTVTDSAAVNADLGAVITNSTTPSSIVTGTTITAVSPGTGYTLSVATTNGSTLSGQTFVVHNNLNQVVTNNRLSRVFFPAVGSAGPFTGYDTTPALGSTWSGNVYHETGAIIAP